MRLVAIDSDRRARRQRAGTNRRGALRGGQAGVAGMVYFRQVHLSASCRPAYGEQR